jgi:hypothetical protein
MKEKDIIKMKEKDLLINQGSEKINAQIEKIESTLKPKPYQYKTNCRFGFCEDEKNYLNLKVLSVLDLLKCFAHVKGQYDNFHQTVTLISAKLTCELPEFTWCGYKMEDWADDITHLVQKSVYAKKMSDLKKYKETLETLYSQDKKDEMLINAILSKLD